MFVREELEHIEETIEDVLDILTGWGKYYDSNEMRIDSAVRTLNKLLVDVRGYEKP